ncbi:MAG: sugar kinase [Planctomycetota bacterium]|nr:MAG: sugar kinase [Planctomycetota bacterium]
MIIAIGSIALDTTRTPFKTVKDVLGGSGTYFGLASSFFSKTGIVAVVGKDFPEEYYKLLKDRLDVSGLKIVDGKTFRFDSSFDYDLGKRTTNKTELNVFEKFDPVLPEEYRTAEYVYLGNIDPEQQLKVLEQVNNPKLTVSDTIELWINTKRRKLIEVISRVDCMVLNDDEVRQLCKTPNIINGAKTILDWGAKFVIVKKGEHGAILFTHDNIFPTPGYPLGNVVDPTGAGDSFAGGFLGHIARKDKLGESTIKEAVVYGNVMGSFAVEDFSINSLLNLTLEQIEDRFQEYRNIVRF